jgi:hypothetical protein
MRIVTLTTSLNLESIDHTSCYLHQHVHAHGQRQNVAPEGNMLFTCAHASRSLLHQPTRGGYVYRNVPPSHPHMQEAAANDKYMYVW